MWRKARRWKWHDLTTWLNMFIEIQVIVKMDTKQFWGRMREGWRRPQRWPEFWVWFGCVHACQWVWILIFQGSGPVHCVKSRIRVIEVLIQDYKYLDQTDRVKLPCTVGCRQHIDADGHRTVRQCNGLVKWRTWRESVIELNHEERLSGAAWVRTGRLPA